MSERRTRRRELAAMLRTERQYRRACRQMGAVPTHSATVAAGVVQNGGWTRDAFTPRYAS